MASTSSSSVNHLLGPFHHRTLVLPKSPSQFKHPQFQSPLNYPSYRVQATSDLVGVVDTVLVPSFLFFTRAFTQTLGLHSIYLLF